MIETFLFVLAGGGVGVYFWLASLEARVTYLTRKLENEDEEERWELTQDQFSCS